jgi:hypothetical protein
MVFNPKLGKAAGREPGGSAPVEEKPGVKNPRKKRIVIRLYKYRGENFIAFIKHLFWKHQTRKTDTKTEFEYDLSLTKG